MKLTDLLDQIDRLDKETTKGPWTTDSTPDEFGIIWGAVEQIGGGFGERAMVTEVVEEHADAEFIALARTALPQLAQALRAVVESCEETIRSVDKNLLPDERDHANRDHADMILDAITDAMEESNE